MDVIQGVRRFYLVDADGGHRRWNGLRVWISCVFIGYLLVAAAGVSSSSIGVPGLLDDPTKPAPGLIAGQPDPIRSDDFLRATPWGIGGLESGGTPAGTPLDFADTTLVTGGLGGPATTAIYLESRLSSWGGQFFIAQRFAASWWLPVLMVLALLPLWLRQLGVRPSIGIPAAVVVVLAPVAVWWSWGPLAVLRWPLLAAVLAILACQRRTSLVGRLGAVVAVVGAGLALSRLGLSYILWAVPFGAVVLLPTVVWMFSRAGLRRRGIAVLGGAVAVTIGSFLLFLREHKASLEVLSATVYPGARRFAGDVTDPSSFFSAPHLRVLQQDPAITAGNQSELSTGYFVLLVAAVVLLSGIRWRQLGRLTLPAATGLAVVGFWTLWCTVTWPAWFAEIPGLSFVSPGRVVQVLGLTGTIVFALVLELWASSERVGRRAGALTAAAVAFGVTALGGSLVRQVHIPSMSIRSIWAVSLLVALGVGIAVGFARRWWGLVPLALLAVPVTIFVNPWQQGFADLQTGAAAQQINRLSVGPGLWASEDIWVDAVLMANARQSLSGQQWIGPNRPVWEVLDPTDQFKNAWNRGGSFVVFNWAAPGKPVTITTTSPDMIVIQADPCDAKLRSLGVTRIVTTHRLKNPCLVPTSSFTIGGGQRWTYDIAS